MSNLYYQVSNGASPTNGTPETISTKNRGSVLSKGFISFMAMAFFLLVGNVAHAQLAATLFVDQDVTCNGGTDGIIRVTASGGPVPYSYVWSDGATSDQNTPNGTVAPDGSVFSLFGSTRTGVAAGVYGVTVTDDAAGTAVAMSVTVTQPDAITLDAIVGTDILCNGNSTGSISTTVSGGTPPYSYTWTNGAVGANPTGLAAGTYDLTVTDANGCPAATGSVTLTEPGAIVPSTDGVTDMTAPCVEDGTISISVAGGVGPYQYSWSNGATTEDLTGLAAGSYTVAITDANGCSTNYGPLTVNGFPDVVISNVAITDVLCAGDATGAIAITASGGDGGFTYAWSNGGTTDNISGLLAGDYTVTVYGGIAGACVVIDTYTVSEPANGLSAVEDAAATQDIDCNGGTASAGVTATGGTPPYTYTWSSSNTAFADPGSASATGLAPGVYSVSVTDAGGCGPEVVGFTFTEPGVLSAGVVNVVSPLCNGGEGTITITASGGTAPLVWGEPLLAPGSATTIVGGVFTVTVSAGQYAFNIQDDNGCGPVTVNATVTEPDAITITETISNITCNGAADGALLVTASGGSGPYTYLWASSNTAVDGSTSADLGAALIAGTYDVTVEDANGCTETASYSIVEPTNVQIQGTASDVQCAGQANGSVDLTVSDGTPPYTYVWASSNTAFVDPGTEDLSGLQAGIYMVSVSDANNCVGTGTMSFTISEPTVLSVFAIASSNVTCNGGSDGAINLNVTGGTPPYSYAWNTGANTQDISGLTAGLYDVVVTDDNGCTQLLSVNITQPDPIADAGGATDITCNGFGDGMIDITISGGTMPYAYAWDNGLSAGTSHSGLSAGTYGLTVTDGNSCTETFSYTVNEPAAVMVSVSPTAPLCPGDFGSATATVSGGVAPFTYLWSTGGIAATETGLLAAGSPYSVTVTDANGCTGVGNVNIVDPTPVSVTATGTNISCNGLNDGSAVASASGGAGGYSYTWSTQGTGSPEAYRFVAAAGAPTVSSIGFVWNSIESTGTYVSLTDDDMSGLLPIGFNVNFMGGVYSSFNISSNGFITFEAGFANGCCSGYNLPNISSWNTYIGAAHSDLFPPNGVGGVYYEVLGTAPNRRLVVEWADIAFCCSGNVEHSSQVILYENSNQVDVLIEFTDAPSSFYTKTVGVSDGVDFAAPANRNAVSNSIWKIGAPNVIGSGANINGLSAGAYTVQATDANGCTASTSVTITEPEELTVVVNSVTDAPCFGENGTVVLDVDGGTQFVGAPGEPANPNGYPYIYSWSGGTTTVMDHIADGVPAGDYTVMVTDRNGCTATTTVSVGQPDLLVATATGTNPSCAGAMDGSASVSAVGGTMPYSYMWSNGSTMQSMMVAAGTYDVTVTDANGCTDESSVTIVQPDPLAIASATVKNSCNPGTDGAVTLSVTGGTGPYTYMWSDGQTSNPATGLAAGSYSVTVDDANGCGPVTANYVITQPAAPLEVANFNRTDVTCAGGMDGEIDNGGTTGGTPPYSYLWSNGETTADIQGIGAGNYSVTVTDAVGCTVVYLNIIINEPAAITVMNDAANNLDLDCNGDTDAFISVTASGGTGTLSYAWSNGVNGQSISGMSGGVYTLDVTDANGCVESFSYTVTEPAAITAVSSVADPLCSSANGGINVTVSGGTPAYTYEWSTGASGVSSGVISLSAGNGTYGLTVTDANGCVETYSYTLTAPAAINIAQTITPTSCNSASDTYSPDGSVSVVVTGGTAPYSYSWSTGATTSMISGLAYGANVDVTVIDANGCSAFESYSIGQAPAVSVVVDIVNNTTCAKGTDGEIHITASGGTGTLSYAWEGPNGAVAGTTDLLNLISGDYFLTVTDANGCEFDYNYFVADGSDPATLALTLNNVICNGAGDGSIEIDVTSGTGPYIVLTTNSSGTTVDSTFLVSPFPLIVIDNLGPDTYSISVIDQNGCPAAGATASITEPSKVNTSIVSTSDASCFGLADGSFVVNADGGIQPYTIEWSNGTTAGSGMYTGVFYNYPWPFYTEARRTVSGLAAGTYGVTVTDANGCKETTSATIGQPSDLNITFTGKDDIDCYGDTTGSAVAAISGGTGPYSYQWYSGSYPGPISPLSGQSGMVVNGLANAVNLGVGFYTIEVTDIGGGCTYYAVFEETGPAPIVLDLVHSASVTCNGGSDGTADVTISGGTAPYAWVVSGAANASGSIATDGGSNSFTGLSAGVYYVDVTDANGCSIPQSSFTITEPAGLTVTVEADSIFCPGGFNATASVVSVTGGIPPYTYLWSNGATGMSTGVNVDGNPLFAGTYTVDVYDATGVCATTVSVNVYEPMPVGGTAVITDVQCAGDCSTSLIDFTPTGGTPPYTYYWSPGSVHNPSNVVSTSQDPAGLCAGTYTVRINDKYGCEGFETFTIGTATSLVVSHTQTNVLCKGDATGAIDFTVSGGTMPYSYSWSNGETTEDISGLAAGSYSVVVTDANGCTTGASFFITEPFSNLYASVIGYTHVSCNGGNDGTADIYVVGGTLPYSYQWSNGSQVQDPTNLMAGVNSVTITDANGCQEFLSVTITQPTALTSGVVSTSNVDCNGGTDGSINISVSGGTTPYTYAWTSNDPLFSASTQDLSGIGAGVYDVVITDDNGCTNAISGITITEPTAVTAVASGVNVNCFGDATGSVSVVASGGTPPYSYLWNTGATTSSLSGLVSGGSYSVVVTDDNGCSVTSNVVTITGPSSPLSAALVSVQDVYTCFGDNSGYIDISVTGGTQPYSFAWSNGATAQNPQDLFAGGYQVTVTDANGCTTFIKGLVVDQPSQLMATIAKATNVDCNGATTGSIDLAPSGGTAPYTYSWSNGAVTQDLSNLAAGTYSVVVTDANGCTASSTVVITEPAALSVTIDATTNVSCNSGTNGMIMSTVAGGTMPYTITWSDGVSGIEDRTGLSAGTYIVNVTDACGVTVSASATLTEPALLTATTVATDVNCFGASNGAVDVTVTGGTMPYQYNWGGGITSEDRTNLAPGTYTVIITDANGCSTTASAVVNGPASPISVSASVTDVLCFGDATGAIDITVTGGTAPYSFSWSNGDNTEDLSNIPAGSYTGTVTDAAGCTFTATVTVAGPASALSASAVSTDVLCNGASTGMIDLTVTGGTAPYTYNWSNGAATQDLMNVPAGSYTGTVTDANGCVASATIVITEPATGISVSNAVVTNVSCNGGTDGAVDITVTGGTPPYSYSWSNGAISQDLNNVPAGVYSGVITDANGCSFTASVTVGQPAALAASTTVTNVNCFGDATGTVDLSITGGTAPYTYAWSNGANTEDLLNVVAGTYNVVVTDANGCTVNASATITQNSAIATSIVQGNVDCFGGSNGSASLNVSGGTPPYTIAWNTGDNTQNINNLSAGTYSVVVTDANGCTANNQVVITEPAELVVTASSAQNSAQATATVTGGTPPYSYVWNSTPAQFTQTAVGLMSGTYSVVVTDANGCSGVASVVVENIGIEEPSLSQQVSLFPNPTANEVFVGYNFSSEQTLEINVVNGLGQVVMTASEPHALDGKLRLDVSELANGVYYVVISNGTDSDNRRLVIQK